MLTEQQIDEYGERFVELFQRLEAEIINDIARRVRNGKRWTETAEIQAEALRLAGKSTEQIRLEVLRRLRADPEYIRFLDENTLAAKAKQQSEIDKALEELRTTAPYIYQEVGNMSFNNDLSYWKRAGQDLSKPNSFSQLVGTLANRNADGLMELTKSLGFKFPGASMKLENAFRDSMNNALVKTLSGAFSATKAVEDAVREMAASGLKTIDYASGRSYQLDVAARLNVRTACGQIAGEITELNVQETGVEYVEVSEHWGARPSHEAWQGKVYTLAEFKTVCGYGEPSTADHIYSYNCRHTHYPYWPGISTPKKWQPEPKPVTINGKRYTYYEATQQQRKMERNIRAMKRQKNAGVDVPKSKITAATQAYKSFSAAAGIKARPELLRVLGA